MVGYGGLREELSSQSLLPKSRIVFIPKEEYNRILSLHSNSVGFDSTATLAQKGTSTACLTTRDPWVIDSGANDHMTGTSSLLFDHEQFSSLHNFTLVDGPATTFFGLGTANFSPNLSLSSVLYIPDFPFNLLSISKVTKLLNCIAIFYPLIVFVRIFILFFSRFLP